jgi:hypothetical protein
LKINTPFIRNGVLELIEKRKYSKWVVSIKYFENTL